jgi:hypothetical protein
MPSDPIESYDSGLLNILLGLTSIGGALLVYWFLASSVSVFTNQILLELKLLSYLIAGLLFVGLFVALFGIRQLLKASTMGFREGTWPSLTTVVAGIFARRKYLVTMLFSGLVYGLFYAIVSSTIIYRPDRDFALEYLATIPSIVTTVCCDRLGFIPYFTIYLTHHLGMLLIPANVMLMVLVSALVGQNIALVRFAYDSKQRGIGGFCLGGFGALTGLFTSCPTCAGLFLGNLLQVAGTEALAATLTAYQPLFLGFTFPVLVASSYSIVRGIRQLLYGSCRINSKGR